MHAQPRQRNTQQPTVAMSEPSALSLRLVSNTAYYADTAYAVSFFASYFYRLFIGRFFYYFYLMEQRKKQVQDNS